MSETKSRPSGPVLDPSGHLSAAGLAAFQAAPLGQAPAEVASHIAGCPSCQERLLVAGAPGPRPKPGRKPMAVAPSPAKTALLLGITLAFVLLALWSLRRLMGQ
jgi:hypothetical protein